MRALFGASDEVAGFVASIIPGCERGFGECQAIGFLGRSGGIEAGVVYHNWQPEADVIEISAASLNPRWVTRARLSLIFGYPFDQIGCRMVVARIAESNTRARGIWRSLGASEYLIPALRSPTEAEAIYTLTAQAWNESRFARLNRGKTIWAETP